VNKSMQLVIHTIEVETEDMHLDLKGDLMEHLGAIKGANTRV
jgi:hypothetical protein